MRWSGGYRPKSALNVGSRSATSFCTCLTLRPARSKVRWIVDIETSRCRQLFNCWAYSFKNMIGLWRARWRRYCASRVVSYRGRPLPIAWDFAILPVCRFCVAVFGKKCWNWIEWCALCKQLICLSVLAVMQHPLGRHWFFGSPSWREWTESKKLRQIWRVIGSEPIGTRSLNKSCFYLFIECHYFRKLQ